MDQLIRSGSPKRLSISTPESLHLFHSKSCWIHLCTLRSGAAQWWCGGLLRLIITDTCVCIINIYIYIHKYTVYVYTCMYIYIYVYIYIYIFLCIQDGKGWKRHQGPHLSCSHSFWFHWNHTETQCRRPCIQANQELWLSSQEQFPWKVPHRIHHWMNKN